MATKKRRHRPGILADPKLNKTHANRACYVATIVIMLLSCSCLAHIYSQYWWHKHVSPIWKYCTGLLQSCRCERHLQKTAMRIQVHHMVTQTAWCDTYAQSFASRSNNISYVNILQKSTTFEHTIAGYSTYKTSFWHPLAFIARVSDRHNSQKQQFWKYFLRVREYVELWLFSNGLDGFVPGLLLINVGVTGRAACLCLSVCCTCVSCIVPAARSCAIDENILRTPMPVLADVAKTCAWCNLA